MWMELTAKERASTLNFNREVVVHVKIYDSDEEQRSSTTSDTKWASEERGEDGGRTKIIYAGDALAPSPGYYRTLNFKGAL